MTVIDSREAAHDFRGTLVAWAQTMGHTEVAKLLQQTLDEEKAADKKLSGLAEGGINQGAADAAHAARASGDEAEHLRRALAVQPPGGDERAAERVDLLIRMGAALRDIGDVLAGREALVDAALIAEARDDHDAVAAALALLSPNDLWAPTDWSLSDARAVSLIERVLADEPAEPTPAGTALKADLSGEVVYSDPDRAAALSAEAVVEAAPLATGARRLRAAGKGNRPRSSARRSTRRAWGGRPPAAAPGGAAGRRSTDSDPAHTPPSARPS